MLSQTFCYWGKQQSADSDIFQFHLTLKCTKDRSSHFCHSFLVSQWIFQSHDRGLTKFHEGSEQLLLCYPLVKHSNIAYHSFGKYCMQARGLLDYRLKYCWPKVFYYICQPNELNGKLRKNWGAKRKSGGAIAHPAPQLELPVPMTCTTVKLLLSPLHGISPHHWEEMDDVMVFVGSFLGCIACLVSVTFLLGLDRCDYCVEVTGLFSAEDLSLSWLRLFRSAYDFSNIELQPIYLKYRFSPGISLLFCNALFILPCFI